MTKTEQFPPLEAPSLMRRAGAMLYDTLLITAMCIGYAALVLWIKISLLGYSLGEGEKASIGTAGFIGAVLLIGCYFCFFWHKSGQTLGMKTWRIEVRNLDGHFMSWPQAIKRWLLACVSLAFLGAGYWWALINSNRQTLHDAWSASYTRLLPKQ